MIASKKLILAPTAATPHPITPHQTKENAMRLYNKHAISLLVVVLSFTSGAAYATDAQFYSQTKEQGGMMPASALVEGQSKAVNLIAGKNAIYTPPASIQEALKTHAWLSELQSQTNTGLVASHPEDTGFIYHEGIVADWAVIYGNTQAYTYDQAITGRVMLDAGNAAGAKKIFDFYYSEYAKEGNSFAGFYTAYNVDSEFWWKKYEWRKGMGESAWIGLFALQYSEKSADTAEKAKGAALATAIGKWIRTLPHTGGAAAMGAGDPSGQPDRGRIYSVENNLDYYALLRNLSVSSLVGDNDRKEFADEKEKLKNWLKDSAFDANAGIFRSGAMQNSQTGALDWGATKSLDVNSWAVSSIGVSELFFDFGIDARALLDNAGALFAVQEDGSFGGNLRTAIGFDFSDKQNALMIGRKGMSWVEGTNQMALAYNLLADFYEKAGDVKGSAYRNLADYFQSTNAANRRVTSSGSAAYSYATDTAQIFFITPEWRASRGKAVASSAWVYFSKINLNPFFLPEPANDQDFVVIVGQTMIRQKGTVVTVRYKDIDGNNVAVTYDGANLLNVGFEKEKTPGSWIQSFLDVRDQLMKDLAKTSMTGNRKKIRGLLDKLDVILDKKFEFSIPLADGRDVKIAQYGELIRVTVPDAIFGQIPYTLNLKTKILSRGFIQDHQEMFADPVSLAPILDPVKAAYFQETDINRRVILGGLLDQLALFQDPPAGSFMWNGNSIVNSGGQLSMVGYQQSAVLDLVSKNITFSSYESAIDQKVYVPGDPEYRVALQTMSYLTDGALQNVLDAQTRSFLQTVQSYIRKTLFAETIRAAGGVQDFNLLFKAHLSTAENLSVNDSAIILDLMGDPNFNLTFFVQTLPKAGELMRSLQNVMTRRRQFNQLFGTTIGQAGAPSISDRAILFGLAGDPNFNPPLFYDVLGKAADLLSAVRGKARYLAGFNLKYGAQLYSAGTPSGGDRKILFDLAGDPQFDLYALLKNLPLLQGR